MNEREHLSPQTPPWNGCTSWRRGLHNGVLKAHPAVKINSYPSIFNGRSGKRNFAGQRQRERERKKNGWVFFGTGDHRCSRLEKGRDEHGTRRKNEGKKKAKYKNARCIFMFLANRHIKVFRYISKKEKKNMKNSRCCGNKRLMGERKTTPGMKKRFRNASLKIKY